MKGRFLATAVKFSPVSLGYRHWARWTCRRVCVWRGKLAVTPEHLLFKCIQRGEAATSGVAESYFSSRKITLRYARLTAAHTRSTVLVGKETYPCPSPYSRNTSG